MGKCEIEKQGKACGKETDKKIRARVATEHNTPVIEKDFYACGEHRALRISGEHQNLTIGSIIMKDVS